MRIVQIATVVIVLACLSCHKSNSDISRLIHARKIESAMINEAPERSEVGSAFVNIMMLSDRRALLLNLFNDSQYTAGRIYALIGLFQIDQSLYHECASKLNPDEKVDVLIADVEGAETVRELLSQIESGPLYHSITWTGKVNLK